MTFWKGVTVLRPASNHIIPERIVKLCSLGLGEDFLALSADHVIYRCTVENENITFSKVPGIHAIDVAFNSGTLYIIDHHGRIFKSDPSSLDERQEVVVKEEAKCCVHGFKTSSYKVKFKNVILSDFGQIFVSKQGQLWASGHMPQMSIESTEIKKITFFEGRTIYGVSLGANFAVVISRRNIRNSSGNDDTNSEDEDEVFVSSCLQCQSTLRLASPPSLQSLSETCPLGIHVSKSSGETSSTSVPQIDVQNDTHSLTEDTSPSTEDSNVTRRLENKVANVNETVIESTEGQQGTCVSENFTGELGDVISEDMKNPYNPDKQNNIIFTNKEAAKQFLSRQLSWVTAGEDYLVEYTEKPTRIIKENVSNLTNFVYEGVKTVGDKVATLSRHVSGSSDLNDTLEVIDKNMEDIHSLLNSFASSYKLDELQFSMSTVASDKEYQNVTNEKANSLVKIGQSVLNTEIWTWGDIEHGQLGIGDTIHRSRPMLVSSLSGLGIQKVSCGSLHCAALSLDGRLFSWGKNNYHQVSFESREDKSSPVQFTENGNTDRIRDFVSSEDHNIAYTLNHNLLYMGKYFMGYTETPQKLDYKKYPNSSVELIMSSDKTIKTNNESLSDNLETLKQCDLKCYHWRILSSGNISYFCVDNKIHSQAIQELSIGQKMLEELLLIYHSLIKPFLKRSQIVTLHTNVYEQLCNMFANIVYVTALNVLSIWQYTENHVNEHEISIIKNYEEYIYLYQKYLNIVCNVICLSGFTQISDIIDVPTAIYDLFSDQLPSSSQKNKKKTAEAIVALAFLHPLSRLSSYKCIIQSLSRYNDKKEDRELKKSVEQKLLDVLRSWDTLTEEYEKRKKESEITKLFWETSGKTLEQYVIPERRLIRESRSKPLHMLNAGRFSSHWFILFNDIFIHVHGSSQTVHPLETFWIEPLGDTDHLQNALQLITPEETFGVSTNTSQDKSEWLHAFQMSIKVLLKKTNSLQPPAVRTATYQFSNKANFYKEAKYTGRWLNGKIHGTGKVEWPDGKVYMGQLHMNSINGYGKMDIPGIGIYDGHWKDNLQCGFGVLKFNSGDVYEGYFKEGLAHGHGVRKQGDFNKSTATIYMGEWQNGVRHGYGVMDDILKGEKYLGSWSDNKKHGCGLIVTLDGIYYEGVFMQDVLTGHGVMIFEDGTHYEGEFRSAGVFSGKGTLIFSSGDRIEGSFSGAWTEGVKISSGTLQMNVSSPALPDNSIPNSFGKLCVAPNQKWNGLFRQCFQQLGIPENLLTPNGTHFCATSALNGVDNKKIWQNVAVMISSSQKENVTKRVSPVIQFKRSPDHKSVDQLELIPHFGQKALTLDSFVELRQYMQTACESTHHPLGQLVLGVTSAFNTTYGGVRVHPLLLSHAVKELKSITSRIYHIVRLLFPVLPPDGCDIVLPYDEHAENADDNNPIDGEIISAAALLQPTLLPRVHPSLFVLYALHNKREDDLYWRRLIKWNRQPDITLMASLGIDQKFWVGYTTLQGDNPRSPSYSPLKEQLFTDAVETLQQLKTTFSPIEKLLVIRSTFQRMTAAVQDELGASYLWSMDELFPVFHFVVVRARILQLGSEIHFIEDFLEPYMQNGELGIMFTTLKACYFQILQEKMSIST